MSALTLLKSEPAKAELSPRLLSVGGLTPLTTTDYPGCLSLVVFCQGCPWRCGYCHNPHLIPRAGDQAVTWEWVLAFLHRRRGLLDAVVFSGGEPTLQSSLIDAIETVKAMGFKAGLHTAGPYPDRLERLLPRLDWVGLDVKAPFDARYDRVTGIPGSGEKARESAALVLSSGVDYEFRTTLHPSLLTRQDILEMAETLMEMGVSHYALQEFRPMGCINAALCDFTESGGLFDPAFYARIESRFHDFSLRHA